MRLWKQAVRQLFRSPGFLAAAGLALALGIGSTTTIFSIVNAVFLRGLPYRDAESLVQLRSTVAEQQIEGAGFSYPRFEAVRDRQTVFSELSYSIFAPFTLTASTGDPEQVLGLQTASDYLPLLGLSPEMGRGFTAEEDRPGGGDVVILSHGLWQRRFGARPDIVGQSLQLDGRPHVVIGVMPLSASRFPMNRVAVWTPRPQEVSFLVRQQIDGGGFFFTVLARLKPGITVEAASAQLATIAQAYAQAHPTNADVKATADVTPLLDVLVGDQRATYVILFAAVACLLLIASANVANLSLARYAARRKQIAIRYALGAGRRHVMAEMVAENIVLALVGGGIGVAFAKVLLDVVKAWAGDRIPRVEEISLDPTVLLVALGVSVVTGLLLGILPALQVAKPDLTDALKDSSRNTSGGRTQARTRSALLIAEVAVSFVLLAAAGLLVASFVRIQNVDPGFRPEGIFIAGIQAPAVRYPDRSEELAQFYASLLERASNLPNVTGAAIADSPPLSGGGGQSPFAAVGRPVPPIGKQPLALRHIVSPGFFDLIGVRFTRGRDFTRTDSRTSPHAVIVNETLVKQAFPDRDPIGQRMVTGMLQLEAEIVGVVADTRSLDLAAAPIAEMYYPVFQRPEGFSNILVKTKGEPLALLASVRSAFAGVDPNVPLTNPNSYAALVGQNTAVRRLILSLLSAFALVALLLAMFGVYSVMAYAVGQRTSEIGVRLAMGALPAQVQRMIVGQGLRLAGLGVAIGIVGALFVTQGMKSLLFETPPIDPLTYVVISALLTGIAALAAWIPARRAASVDPLTALRDQ